MVIIVIIMKVIYYGHKHSLPYQNCTIHLSCVLSSLFRWSPVSTVRYIHREPVPGSYTQNIKYCTNFIMGTI